MAMSTAYAILCKDVESAYAKEEAALKAKRLSPTKENMSAFRNAQRATISARNKRDAFIFPSYQTVQGGY
jgi:hypothetical protein